MGLTIDMIVMFVNKMSEELAHNSVKAYELLNVADYFVSDIVDTSRFASRDGEKIIRATNTKKILQGLFGKDNTPMIGKRVARTAVSSNDEMNAMNPMVDYLDIYLQPIIPKNMTIFRAYANGYYWSKHVYHDANKRNLGYYGDIQTTLANNFRAYVIDWLGDTNNKNKITPEMQREMGMYNTLDENINAFIDRIVNDSSKMTNGMVELQILSDIIGVPVIVHNTSDEIVYVFDKGMQREPTRDTIGRYELAKCINIKYDYQTNNRVPDSVHVIYYKAIDAKQRAQGTDAKQRARGKGTTANTSDIE
jgi:hypothetical protein